MGVPISILDHGCEISLPSPLPCPAGKSNLMDAISFVLGVRSKHLRASELKHLVHGAGYVHTRERRRECSFRGLP